MTPTEVPGVQSMFTVQQMLTAAMMLRGVIPSTNEDTGTQTGTVICLSQAAVKAQDRI